MSPRSISSLQTAFPPLILMLAGCAVSDPVAESGSRSSSFERVRPVLESSCVHCHGPARLPNMPSLTSTKALASITGPGKLIVPGAPEKSRFFQVVTLSDDQVGAMPPTGHALESKEIAIMRRWILEGAKLPQEDIALTPRGEAPRSR